MIPEMNVLIVLLAIIILAEPLLIALGKLLGVDD